MSVELSPAAAKHLRNLGRSLSAAVQIGKSGLSEGLIGQLDTMLTGRELVKIKALDTAPDDPDRLAERLASATGAAVVGVIGRTALLYRPSSTLADDKRIKLP